MNEIMISGAVQNTDLRYTVSGLAVLTIRLAGRGERPHFLTVTVLGDQAQQVADNIKEGDVLLVGGSVTQRQGEEGTFTNILARTVRILPGAQVEEGLQAGAINRFLGIGFLARDPEERVEGRLVRARVAFNRRGKDGKKEAVFLTVEAWEEVGDLLRGLKKGAQVYVEGLLRGRAYTTRAGEKRYEIYVSARDLRLLGYVPKGEAVEASSEEEEFPAPEDLPF